MRKSDALAAFVCVWMVGCGKQAGPGPESATPAAPQATFKIDRLEPSFTTEKTDFNVQRDGQTALSVAGADIPLGSTVTWNEQALKTVGGGSTGWVAATVPANLYESPGNVRIAVRNSGSGATSNALDFTIYPKSGPAPKIIKLYPDSTVAGKGFNLQPNGDSALGVAGDDFLPGVKLLLDGKQLTTVFGKGTGLSAIVPAAPLAHAGTHQVWAVNSDGKISNKAEFTVGK